MNKFHIRELQVPVWVAHEYNISLVDATAYAAIVELQDEGWYYQDLADLLHISKKSVWRIIQKLSNKGLIKIEQTADEKGKRNVIIPLL